jgi:hypothetical protein
MAEANPSEGWHRFPRYLAGVVIGIVVLVGIPEIARWLHGGAFAQTPQAGLWICGSP